MLSSRDHPANKHPEAEAPAQARGVSLSKEIHPFQTEIVKKAYTKEGDNL
jgi:hypothetical protein